MKCPMCDGSGKCYEQKIRYQEIETNRTDFTLAKCHKCNGTGEVQMTNEDWIKSLDTEGLVDYLYRVHKGGDSVERQRWIERHKEQVKMQFRGWLKEKHDG